MSPMPVMRQHVVQSGEHIKRDFGKPGQCPEKNDVYGKDLESMLSQETWWKEGTGYMIVVFRYLWKRD